MIMRILMLLALSVVTCFADAFKADSGTFGTATASAQMDNQGNYRQTNTITHAHITLGTNGHIWAVDQYGTVFQYFTNGVSLTWTNGRSIFLTNGFVSASAGIDATKLVGAIPTTATLPASQLTGPLPLASLPAVVLTNNQATPFTNTSTLTQQGAASFSGVVSLPFGGTNIITGGTILLTNAGTTRQEKILGDAVGGLELFGDQAIGVYLGHGATIDVQIVNGGPGGIMTPLSNLKTDIGSTSLRFANSYVSNGWFTAVTSSNGVFTQLRSTNGNYTCALSDENVLDAAPTNSTVTLPTAVGNTGKQFVIKNTGSGVCTVGTTSSQNIDGATTKALTAQYSSIVVRSDGTQWWIVAEYGPSLSLAQNIMSNPNTLVAGVGMMLVCVSVANTRKRKRLGYPAVKQIEA